MLGTHIKQAYRPQRRVLEGLLCCGRLCFVTRKVQLSGEKTNRLSTLPFSVITSGSSRGGELLCVFLLKLNPRGSFSWTHTLDHMDSYLDLMLYIHKHDVCWRLKAQYKCHTGSFCHFRYFLIVQVFIIQNSFVLRRYLMLLK